MSFRSKEEVCGNDNMQPYVLRRAFGLYVAAVYGVLEQPAEDSCMWKPPRLSYA
jgi:hypothetical protein